MRLHHWIDGRPVPPSAGRWLDVHEPANGRVLGEVAAGDAADVDAAVAAAHAAFPGWSALRTSERSRRS
ncbi:MAG TPA: aldehyde dehydrogenase family protein, partial [Lysobacter sp.]|nr:aldehyde dehydrogenase family protein [Lysobacter sp.]